MLSAEPARFHAANIPSVFTAPHALNVPYSSLLSPWPLQGFNPPATFADLNSSLLSQMSVPLTFSSLEGLPQPEIDGKIAAFRMKWQQERDRRAALLKQSEELLLNRKELEAKQHMTHMLQQQLMKDTSEREGLLETLTKQDSSLLQFKKILQQQKDDEEKQLDRVRNMEGENRNLRSQITEQENQLLTEQTQFADRTEEINSSIQSLKRMESELQSNLSKLIANCSSQVERQKLIENQLNLAEKELERLKMRVPANYQMIEPSSAAEVSEAVPSFRGEGPSITSTYVGHKPTEVGEESGTNKSRPILGLEVREGANGVVRVSAVSADGPAFQAGIRVGDVLKVWNGRNVTSKQAFSRAITASGIGVPVKVELERARSSGSRVDSLTFMITSKASKK